jgi:two-component system phosphate regulon sensor histidine kinase PhoR
VTIKEITASYTAKLKEEKMDNLAFSVSRLDSSHSNSPDLNEVTIGFTKPMSFRLTLENKVSYLLKKLTLPILFSLFLVGITIVSFVLLYRNVVKQRRLAELKNEFISNITHELKTPIATVGVAIEALKNFNAMHDPQRTKEYLDISQNELQRLSLLVDKVLKLSMFEKNEMELKKEQFDYRQLVEEVMNSMKLQFEKYHAKVNLHTEGENFIVEADKLHITSVVYNLLDNALKYSKENPVIDVQLTATPESIGLSVSDNGIGIEPAYKEKIFDKFFRVPTGDKHNIKGYGLGLSYVAEVIKRHHGNIQVESELGKGSTFTARFPFV